MNDPIHTCCCTTHFVPVVLFCNICVVAFNKSVSWFETHGNVVKICVITPLVLGQSECSGSLRIPPL